MDLVKAEKKLDRVQAEGKAVPAKLLGVPVNVAPQPGNSFLVMLSMANQGAVAAARRLNDAAANVTPWPPEGHVSALCTWDTTLHYLVATDDLVF